MSTNRRSPSPGPNHTTPSRPTTPLRPSSRTSFRSSHNASSHPYDATSNPLDSLEPQFAELSDSLADLEANFMHLQLMHESLARFGENFAAFLYGLNMNAFVVDFPEAPIGESIKRWQRKQREQAGLDNSTIMTSKGAEGETVLGDTTSMSNASMKATPRRKSVMPPTTPGTAATATTATTATKSSIPSTRGGPAIRGTRGARGGRGSGLPRGARGTARGVR